MKRDKDGKFLHKERPLSKWWILGLILMLLPWFLILRNKTDLQKIEDFFASGLCNNSKKDVKSEYELSGDSTREEALKKNMGFGSKA